MVDSAFLFADAVDKLKVTVQQGRSIDAAQVRVVGLGDIRAAAGENWGRLKERIRANSLAFLSGCVGPDDIVIPAGDGFLVVYAPSDTRDMERESASLQDSLNAFYVGEEGMEKLRSKVKGVSVDKNNMHEMLAGAHAAPRDEAHRPAQPAEQPAHRLMYSPVWSAPIETVASYCLSPTYRGADGALQCGYDPAYRAEAKLSEDTYLDTDIAQVQRAIAAALSAPGAARLIGANVHCSTLRARALRGPLLKALQEAPAAARKYLMLQIAEIEHGAPLISIGEWVGMLRGMGYRAAIELHPNETNLQGLGSVGAWAVTVNFASTRADADERRKNASNIARWASGLHKQNLKFAAGNLWDPLMAGVAARAGADFISSQAIWPLRDTPGELTRFSRASLEQAAKGTKAA